MQATSIAQAADEGRPLPPIRRISCASGYTGCGRRSPTDGGSTPSKSTSAARGADAEHVRAGGAQPGDRVLELACGAGGAGLAAAGLVGPAARSCSPTSPRR